MEQGEGAPGSEGWEPRPHLSPAAPTRPLSSAHCPQQTVLTSHCTGGRQPLPALFSCVPCLCWGPASGSWALGFRQQTAQSQWLQLALWLLLARALCLGQCAPPRHTDSSMSSGPVSEGIDCIGIKVTTRHVEGDMPPLHQEEVGTGKVRLPPHASRCSWPPATAPHGRLPCSRASSELGVRQLQQRKRRPRPRPVSSLC